MEEPQSILKGIPEAAPDGIPDGINWEIFETTPGAFLDRTLLDKPDRTSEEILKETPTDFS